MHSFTWRPAISTLLAPGQNDPGMFRQPRQDRRVFSEFLCAALHMALDGSDDTAQHHCVFDQSVLKACLLFTASSDVTSVLQFSATRFLNAIIAGSVSLFNVISLYPDELMNLATLSLAQRFFNSLLQNYAVHKCSGVCPPSPRCTSLTHLVSSEISQWNLA